MARSALALRWLLALSVLSLPACGGDGDTADEVQAGEGAGGDGGTGGTGGSAGKGGSSGKAGSGGSGGNQGGQAGKGGSGGSGGNQAGASGSGGAGAAGAAGKGGGGAGQGGQAGQAGKGGAGQAGQAGSSGQAGQAGQAGKAGQGGEAGAGGQAGEAGASGQGGEAGSGGSGGNQGGSGGSGGASGQGGSGGSGGAACGDTEKLCQGACVSITDPATGCGEAGSCAPCALPHATAGCSAGACSVGSCEAGFTDCDGLASNGCEVQLASDPSHCGACDKACAPGEQCEAGQCGVFCPAGKANCDNDAQNGCETDLGTDANCASCGDACSAAKGTAACVSGACALTACDAGFADCDKSLKNGCEVDTGSSLSDCGGCGQACSVDNGTAVCASGACQVGSCSSGFGDCDKNPQNGCETDLLSSLSSCGACGAACSVAHGTPSCIAGACGVAACDTGFADCDGDPTNGCEVSLLDDVNHCGACVIACSAQNGTAACSAGACSVASCDAGFADCNKMAADGCEVNTKTDVNNCNACGSVCPGNNGTPACQAGICGVTGCSMGFGDCDLDPKNGCEVDLLSSAGNCGSCGNACSVAHGSAACQAGSCSVASCTAPFANCDNLPGNGCEVDTSSDPNNCGGCGNKCSVANGTASCVAGKCAVASCNAGFGDCNGMPQDGCEADLKNNGANCGTCGNNCAADCVGGVTATACTNGSCGVLACSAGKYNVDGACANGCECTSSGTSSSCAAPSSLGALQIGQTVAFTGNLVPAGQDAYLKVTFNGNTNLAYHPHVKLTANPGGEFLFDILYNCQTWAMACGVEAGVSTGRTDWETLYAAGADPNSNDGSPSSSHFQAIPAVGNNGTIIIRVFRKPGLAVSCNSYTLTVSN